MSESFKINTDQAGGQATAVSANASEIRNIARQILACKNQLRINTGSSVLLKLQIAQMHDQALTAAAQLDTLKEALEEIVRLYAACEQRIVGNATGIPVENSNENRENSEEGADKRNWWQRFIDWLFGKDTDTNYTHTTAEQEAAADAQMQQQIADLCDTDRFSEDTWENATVEERKDILEEYMREILGIMGIDVAANIDFTPRPPTGGYITNGSYSPSSNSVYINGYIIENYSAARSYELMTTIVHELRHAYQHAAVDNPTRYQVSQETIDRWSDSFDNYRGSDRIRREDGVSQDEAYRRYRNQAVEVDARSFAGQD